jgi:hypothetical protein
MQLLALNSEHAPHTGSMATTTFGNPKETHWFFQSVSEE